MQIAGLKEYIIISSTTLYIQIARRKSDGLWQFTEFTGREASICIQTIQYQLALKEIYDRVEF